jgi:hypothetical protein
MSPHSSHGRHPEQTDRKLISGTDDNTLTGVFLGSLGVGRP